MIYLFDKDEKLIKIIRKPAIKTALQKFSLTTENYVSDRLTVEMKALKDDELAKLEYMAIQSIDDTHKFHYFYIAQGNTKGDITTLVGVQSGIEELRKTVVYDKRPTDQRARPVIEWLLTGTNWSPRFIAETNPKSANFYYISTFDALKKVCKVWGLEMQFFVEMNGSQIGARYIDFKRKIGEAVGKRVVYGHNALEILQEVEKTNLYTALVGRGKGEQVSSAEDTGKDADGYGRKINFEEIVWSKAKGDPLDKPLGQKYLEIPEMTAKYGIKQPDGKMRPKIGFVEFSEEEDKNELIKQTYEALIESSRPKLTLKTSTVYLKGVQIGDTIRVVRHDRHLDYDTRIFEITFNRLNNESSDIKLGDRVSESNDAKVQSTVSKALDEFKVGEFTEFVKKLPEFIPSANGFNHNWYTSTDPTESHPGQVLINDSWYKPDPEHEGHTIMYRWTGEMWQEVLRTWDGTGLQDKIKKEFEKVAANMAKQQSEHDRVVAEITAKATNAETLASSAKSTAEDAFGRLNDIKSEAIAEARYLDSVERTETEKKIAASKKDALSEAVKLVDNAKSTLNTDLSETEKKVEALKGSIGTLSNDTSVQFAKINNALISVASKQDVDKVSQRVSNAETILTQQAGQISAKASKEDVNAVSGRLNKAESSLTVQAGQINQKANKQDVDTLTGRVNRAETSITQQADMIASKANKQELDNVNNRVINAESRITQQANEISQRVKTSDFNNATQRLATAESSITQTDNKISLKADRTEVQTAKATADSAVSKSQELERKINQTNAELRVTADSIAQKVSRVDFDNLGNKVTNAETQISTLAGKIETKISRVDLDSAIDSKGFLKESDVNRLVDNKGFATATAVTNLIQQSEQGTTQLISEVKKQIPSIDTLSVGGENLIRNSAFPDNLDGWGFWEASQPNSNLSVSSHSFYYNGSKPLFLLSTTTTTTTPSATLRFPVKRNANYSLNVSILAGGNLKGMDIYFLGRKSNESKTFSKVVNIKHFDGSPSTIGVKKFHFTFNSGECDEGFIRIDNTGTTDGSQSLLFFTELDCYEGTMDRAWQPSPKDASQEVTVKFNEIKSTVDSFSRTIGEQGQSLSQVVQTANGLVTTVKGLQGLANFNNDNISGLASRFNAETNAIKTEMSQIAGSWAVKNLTNTGDVLNQINLNKDGSVKIDGKLVQITGSTYIEDGVISSAKIGELSASKITSGRLNASLVDVVNLNASSVTSGTFTGLNYRGGRIESLNGSMFFDLNSNYLQMGADTASIRRVQPGYPAQFIRYETSIDQGNYRSKTIIGSNREGTDAYNATTFSGVVIQNNTNNDIDTLHLYGDRTYFRHTFTNDGWDLDAVTQRLRPGMMEKDSQIWSVQFATPKNGKDFSTGAINITESLAAVWRMFKHFEGNIKMPNELKTLIQHGYNNYGIHMPVL